MNNTRHTILFAKKSTAMNDNNRPQGRFGSRALMPPPPRTPEEEHWKQMLNKHCHWRENHPVLSFLGDIVSASVTWIAEALPFALLWALTILILVTLLWR